MIKFLNYVEIGLMIGHLDFFSLVKKLKIIQNYLSKLDYILHTQ